MELDTITLVSYEGIEFQASSLLLHHSSILNNMPDLSEKIHLSKLKIDSESLQLLIEYYSHYSYNPPTVLLEKSRDLNLLKLLPSWDIQFVQSISDEVLSKLIHCCVRLEVSPLLELLCVSIASRFKDLEEVQKQHKVNFDSYQTPECQVYLKHKYSRYLNS